MKFFNELADQHVFFSNRTLVPHAHFCIIFFICPLGGAAKNYTAKSLGEPPPSDSILSNIC
jgi:hypothetical protein